jgi:hypothetical protein
MAYPLAPLILFQNTLTLLYPFDTAVAGGVDGTTFAYLNAEESL